MKKIALFASGNGTNVQQIAEYFKNNDNVKIDILIVNRKDAFVIERAKKLKIDYTYYNRENFYNSTKLLNQLKERKIDLIVLAGFLWIIPQNIIENYNNRIINIHPALLPKYGGKGMYGENVHKAVIENKEKESGITIHYVNDKYDEGEIIFQARCIVDEKDTPQMLAEKIHKLEKQYYPKVIEDIIKTI
ncbi:MAG: phosphoribosylglycinamide formyltransferase [Bacteroidales bacterium]|jgi:phosphoribosylglycinamide formyltransferase-1|nr:phosphoribosylglycinamide formyltransferase [Bacteroidales bacterium]